MQLLTLLREIVIEPEDSDRAFLRYFKDSLQEYIQEILTTEISVGHSSPTSTAEFRGVSYIDIEHSGRGLTYFEGDFPTAEWIAKFVVNELDQRGITTKRAFLYQAGLIDLDEKDINSSFPTNKSILDSINYRKGGTRQALWFCNSGGFDTGRALVVTFGYN